GRAAERVVGPDARALSPRAPRATAVEAAGPLPRRDRRPHGAAPEQRPPHPLPPGSAGRPAPRAADTARAGGLAGRDTCIHPGPGGEAGSPPGGPLVPARPGAPPTRCRGDTPDKKAVARWCPGRLAPGRTGPAGRRPRPGQRGCAARDTVGTPPSRISGPST